MQKFLFLTGTLVVGTGTLITEKFAFPNLAGFKSYAFFIIPAIVATGFGAYFFYNRWQYRRIINSVQHDDYEFFRNNASRFIKNRLGKPYCNDEFNYRTLLHFAALSDNTIFLNFVLPNFPDLSIQDEDGNTALHLAVLSRKIDSIRLLLSAKANQAIKNNNNKTASELAEESGGKIMELFIQHNFYVFKTKNKSKVKNQKNLKLSGPAAKAKNLSKPSKSLIGKVATTGPSKAAIKVKPGNMKTAMGKVAATRPSKAAIKVKPGNMKTVMGKVAATGPSKAASKVKPGNIKTSLGKVASTKD